MALNIFKTTGGEAGTERKRRKPAVNFALLLAGVLALGAVGYAVNWLISYVFILSAMRLMFG